MDIDGDPMVGRYVADRYRILIKVGEGGMGDVYAAEDLAEDRLVALKIMRRNIADPAAPERFLREAETLARVRSRNIVRLYAFDRDMQLGLLFVAMELATGDDLSTLLDHGRLPPGLAVRVLQETSRGLQAAHEVGIVHRDLKPSNLKLKPKSDHTVRVKILDFGLVRDHNATSEITDLGTAPGTITYMPPEVFRNEEIDLRGDLYSLGVIGYEMLRGVPPFRGTSRLEVAKKHLYESVEPLTDTVGSEVPRELIGLVESLLRKDPKMRPPDATELLDALDEIADREGYRARVEHLGPSKDPVTDWGLLPRLA